MRGIAIHSWNSCYAGHCLNFEQVQPQQNSRGIKNAAWRSNKAGDDSPPILKALLKFVIINGEDKGHNTFPGAGRG
jgi:hypothetical protein